MSLSKDKPSLAAYKEPVYGKRILAECKGDLNNIPQKEQEKMATRKAAYEQNKAAQTAQRQKNTNHKQTQKVQDLMDQMYRWTAGPKESGNPSRRPLQWTGTMNIHSCMDWWTSTRCLYMHYPFVDPEVYDVIRGLHEIFSRILTTPVPQAELKRYRPKMVETLELHARVIPENHHGILVHCIEHCYDFATEVGSDALAFSMYVFERVVAMYNRLINDKSDPEYNLVRNLDFDLQLENEIRRPDASSTLTRELSQLPKSLRNAVGLNRDAPEEDNDDHLTITIRKETSTEHQLSALPVGTGFELLGQTPTVNEVHTSIVIQGFKRRNVSMEPPIGAVGGTRRSSGFEFLNTSPGQSRVFGELLRFFSITGNDNPTVLYVRLYTAELHTSGQMRVQIASERVQYILPREVGQAVVFAPWFDREQMEPNRSYYKAEETVPKYSWL
jgi:hypothetical protein